MRKLLILVPAVLLVAGCGGGAGGSALSAAALRTKADAICASVNKQADAAANASNLDQALKVTQAGLKQLQALKPPGSLKTQYAAFTDALGSGLVPVLKQGVAAFDAKDPVKAQALNPKVDAADAKVKKTANAVGLKTCAAS
jgi:hypothetical protein